MSTSQWIALDLGTSFIKGAVLDLEALRLRHILRVPFPAALAGQHPLHCETDPGQILAAVQDALTGLLKEAPHCAGIVLCTQMHGLIFCDEKGSPLSNFLSWLDQRALRPHPSGQGTFFDVLASRVSENERRQMGSELRPGLPISALFTFLEEGKLPSPGAIPATLPGFVLANLCQAPPACEATNASAHGAFNLETGDWHRPVLQKLEMENINFPRLVGQGEVVGYLSTGGERIPCYAPVGDQPCSLTGALLRAGELSINASTGAQVSLLSPRLEYGTYQVRPAFDGNYLKIITHIPGGRSLTALVDLLTETSRAANPELDAGAAWDYLLRAAEEAGPTDLKADLSFYASVTGSSGSIGNIREDNLTAGHLFRAAFDNMAENFYTCALRLSPGKEWERLVFSGGLVQKIDLLRRLIVDRFDCSYRLAPSSEDSLVGLLALALTFSGRTKTVSEAVEVLSLSPRERVG